MPEVPRLPTHSARRRGSLSASQRAPTSRGRDRPPSDEQYLAPASAPRIGGKGLAQRRQGEARIDRQRQGPPTLSSSCYDLDRSRRRTNVVSIRLDPDSNLGQQHIRAQWRLRTAASALARLSGDAP